MMIHRYFIFLIVGYSMLSFAETSTNTQAEKLRQAISLTQQDLAEKQNAQKQAQKIIERAESTITQIKKELEALDRKQTIAFKRLQNLQSHLHKLQADIGNNKAQIARLISSNYKNKQVPALVLFLRKADMNQKSRFLMYTKHINAANDRVIQQLAQQEKQLALQEAKVNEQVAELTRLSEQQQAKIRQLGQESSQAQEKSQQLRNEIASKQRKLAQLREDEKRMNQVLNELSEQNRAEVKIETTPQHIIDLTQPSNHNLTGDELNAKPQDSSDLKEEVKSDVEQVKFANLQGRLNKPSRHPITGRFGAPRGESGDVWNGLFFAGAPTAVQSIAAGKVSYVGVVGGYGKTIIIDHGEGYTSTYTGLSNISVHQGSQVKARQNIGTSGGLPSGEEGLYMELRYRKGLINPNSWLGG